MLKFLLFCQVLFASISFSYAQQEQTKRASLGAGYFAKDGSYPGFTFNYERVLLANSSLALVVNGKAGAYFHRHNHTGVFVLIQSGQRYKLRGNLYAEHFVGIGYLHSFLNGGDLYYVDATGIVRKASNKGNPHFMPSVSVGLNYWFDKERPKSVFLRPMIFWQIPFNTKSLVQFGLEVGATLKMQ